MHKLAETLNKWISMHFLIQNIKGYTNRYFKPCVLVTVIVKVPIIKNKTKIKLKRFADKSIETFQFQMLNQYDLVLDSNYGLRKIRMIIIAHFCQNLK